MSKKPNPYLAKQQAMMQSAFEIGEEKVFRGAKKMMDEYHLAFTDHEEADYMQEQLDAALREIWKDELQPFYERYPYLKKIDYTKSIKGGSKG